MVPELLQLGRGGEGPDGRIIAIRSGRIMMLRGCPESPGPVGEDAMTEKLHLAPGEPFPEDLSEVPDRELQVLDSQVQRQLDREIVSTGEPDPETEFRHYELDEEFETRDVL